MNKVLITLLMGTFLFAQTNNIYIVKKHQKETGDLIIKKDSDDTLCILAENPNLDNATEKNIWKYFLSSKTAKFVSRYKQLHYTY